MFVIEICTPQNQPVHFPPLRELLRGRWSFRAMLGRSAHESVMKIQSVAPEIPGIHVSIDLKNRTASRFDPLAELEVGRKIWAGIEPILKDNKAHFPPMKPLDKIVREKLSDDDCKLWLHWMRHLVNEGCAMQTTDSEDLPTIEQIAAMPGKRDNNPSGHKTPIPGGHFVDVVSAVAPAAQQQQASGGGRR